MKLTAANDTLAAIQAAHKGLRFVSEVPNVTLDGPLDSYAGSTEQTIKEVNVRTFSWLAAKQACHANAGTQVEHTVRPGETVWSILRANGHTAGDLADGRLVARVARGNGVADANRPFPGQRLNIPVRAARN